MIIQVPAADVSTRRPKGPHGMAAEMMCDFVLTCQEDSQTIATGKTWKTVMPGTTNL